MNTYSKFSSAMQFFLALVFLFNGLLWLTTSLTYNGSENHFSVENWVTPLVFLLTLLFGLGWWFGNAVENLILNKGRKIALFALFGLFLVYALIGLGSILFFPLGFLHYALLASSSIIFSGHFFRLSIIRPEILAKLQGRN